jgi:membrane protein DedA with SNARE-associated domain/membrane-associated phospholipid phosphatase
MTLQDIKPIFEWLQLNPLAAGGVTFLVCFFECLLLVGLLIPGTVIMTAIGTLIGMGILPFTSITLWAIAGAITGDVVSFLIGYHYRERTATLWPFYRYPKLLQKGKDFFDQHGIKSIFIGRFIGPLRPVLPLIAGMVSMPKRQFIIADSISAVFWAPIYMLPGILLGQASQQLPPDVATKLLLFVVLVLTLFWVIYSLIRSCSAWFHHALDAQIAKLWHFTQQHPRLKPLTSFLIDPYHPKSHTPLALFLGGVFSLLGFILVALSVKNHGILTAWNEPIYHLMHSLRSPGFDRFFVAVTEISPRVLILFWGAVLLIFLIKRYFWASLHWVLLLFFGYGLGSLVKNILRITRPTGLIQTPTGFSFPSGHTFSSVCILGFFAVLIALDRKQKTRNVIYGTTALLISVILFSRIYLTAHWFTDVLGGLFLGLSVVFALTLSYRRKKNRPSLTQNSWVGLALLILVAIWGGNLYREYGSELAGYQLKKPVLQSQRLEDWWSPTQNTKPLYRTNVLGERIDILNLQWAGPLSSIQQQLEKKGWHVIPKKNFWSALYQFTTRQNDEVIPLLIKPFYAGKPPVLVMSLCLTKTHRRLLLLLWETPTRFENNWPLWVGMVHSQQTWRLQFQATHHVLKQSSPAAGEVLFEQLAPLQIKRIFYPAQHKTVYFVKSPEN